MPNLNPNLNRQPREHPYQWPAMRPDPPCTSGGLTVFPIRNGHGGGGGYILLADAVAKGIAEVSELDERGEVPVLVITNHGKIPVLGIQGEEYVGAKQNRSLNISVLAGPGKTRIPVTCVEQGRWDPGVTGFAAGAYETMKVRAMKSANLAASRKSVKDLFKKFFSDQGQMWRAVDEESIRYCADSPTMAMSAVYKAKSVKGPLDDIVNGINLPDDTLGVVVAIGGRLVAADLFEHRNVFARIWPRILRSYALGALHVEKSVPPSVEAAESFVSRPRSSAWNATPSVGLGEDVSWEGEQFLASALVWQDRFLHATMLSRDAA